MDEFRLISDYFDRHTGDSTIIRGIGDDGAVVAVESGQQVHVLDTMVEGVHFPTDSAPADIAWRAVAVNLSDIAAMGATPQWMTLGLTLPEVAEAWVKEFAAGLFEVADEYGVKLIGGDTTSGPVVVVTIAMSGTLRNAPFLRSGAQVGDSIYVTGTLGDAAGGLELGDDAPRYLRERFLRPTPRLEIATRLVDKATAAIDVSDGLAGDLAKLLEASGRGGELRTEQLPLSEALKTSFPDKRCRELALTGGDDYELCFTGPAGLESVGATCIGTVTDSGQLKCMHNGAIVDVDTSGYRHFQ